MCSREEQLVLLTTELSHQLSDFLKSGRPHQLERVSTHPKPLENLTQDDVSKTLWIEKPLPWAKKKLPPGRVSCWDKGSPGRAIPPMESQAGPLFT